MFAIGHFALGYLAGKGTSKLAKINMNLPLLLAVSVLPDLDLALHFLMHRGPTHSLITVSLLMIPFVVVYRKQVVLYYAALLSHSLIGDFFTGGTQLFWPLSQGWFGALSIEVTSFTCAVMELALFSLTLPIMYKFGDLKALLKAHSKTWALIIPLIAVLGPLLEVGQGQEESLPLLLVVPSLIFVGLFGYSFLVKLRAKNQQDASKANLQSSKRNF
jgi:membrane-bound metal-dependent hydrolase YbcI (DUF457 family)